jgi:hypothetical protein
MTADSIVFFRKVSSESSDMLKFYINNQLMEDWSGTTGGWKREAFAVGAGIKTFKWVYEKNSIGSGGSDCAWLDFIVLPAPLVLTIWAGPDDKVCSGEPFQVGESYGTDYSLIEWATSGSGTFDDNTNMHPLYNPSSEDISSGEVILTLTLWDDQGTDVIDEMALGFKDVPSMPGTPQGPVYVDLALVQVSEYYTDGLEEAENYSWYIGPAEAGVIIGDETNATVSWSNDFTGTAYISVAGTNACGDGIISDALAVQIENTLVGIADNLNSSFSLGVYPNPATDVLNITINGENTEDVELQLADGMGRIYNISRSVNLEGFRPGLYMLIAKNGNQKIVRKLIIR